MAPKRKYDNSHIKFGFTSIERNGEIKPQCFLCTTVLANDALKPAKLKRHLETVHPNFSDRPPEFFEGKLENRKKMKLGPSGTRFESSEKMLTASFEISKLIAQSEKPHTIGETLVKPCLIKAVEEVLGLEAKKKIQKISLSDNTVKSRIGLMSNDIEEQLVSRIKKSPCFALQCDESIDISNCCQLLVFVRFLDDDNVIKEKLLISRELETTSKGIDVVNIITEYFEKHNIMWEKLVGFCTDGAAAMLGSRSGLATLIKQKNPSAVTTHCIIHRQALASKTLPECLNNAMQLAIKVVNVIKSSALNTRLFRKLCTEMDSDHEALLFHTQVRWLSKGNMLRRLYELREKVKLFLAERKIKSLLEQFSDLKFQMQLAYLVDIFTRLNKLNLQLQGSGNINLEGAANIFIFEDKLLRAFVCKLKLWIGKVDENNYSAFAILKAFVGNKKYDMISANIQENIKSHLQILAEEFNRYFPEYNQTESEVDQKLIRNPSSPDVGDVAEEIQEELLEFQNDRNSKGAFVSESLEEFWCKKAISYTKIRAIALRYLMLFSTTYLFEQGFSALLVIKNKSRNRLKVIDDMRVALSKNISPRITQLVEKMQAQKSH